MKSRNTKAYILSTSSFNMNLFYFIRGYSSWALILIQYPGTGIMRYSRISNNTCLYCDRYDLTSPAGARGVPPAVLQLVHTLRRLCKMSSRFLTYSNNRANCFEFVSVHKETTLVIVYIKFLREPITKAVSSLHSCSWIPVRYGRCQST